MEVPLVSEREEEKKWVVSRRAFVDELKKLSFLEAPMVGVTVSQYHLPDVTVMIVGHLGELSLGNVAIATSFPNVTGFIPIFSLACALETLCEQAYGAEQYQKIGTYTYSAIFFCIMICAYYLVGIPAASVLAFVLNLTGKGLWIGTMTGSTVKGIVLTIITAFTN